MATKNNNKVTEDDDNDSGVVQEMPGSYFISRGSVPVPDPTKLTTDQLRQEIKALRELIESRINSIESLHNVLEQKVESDKTAFAKADQNLRELMEEKICRLRTTNEEIFERINVQFLERDKRTEQLSIASSTAIAAALQAAKEAVGAQNTSNSIAIAKSEGSTIESIRQLQTLFNTSIASIKDQMDDIKSRVDKAEGQVKGAGLIWGLAIGLIGAVFGIIGIVSFVFKVIR
jgi:hypothetical protein